MATLFTPTTEFVDIVDGLEAVTVRFPGSAGTTAVAHAKRRAISTREAAASGGRYTSTDVNWHLPISECPNQPKLGSKIVDADGVWWTVLDVMKCTRGTRWKCASRALEIVAGLDTTIRIQQARYSKSPSGAQVASYFDVVSGLKAKIQPVSATNARETGLDFTRRQFRIVVSKEVAIDNTMRVVGSDGTVYQIDGYEQTERLDVLPVILASTDPWPET